MEKTLRIIYIFGLSIIIPTEVWGTSCAGGRPCPESQECCPGGCCLPRTPPLHRPPHHPDYFNFTTPMKYYLWLLLTLAAFVLTLAWCCRLRQQAPHWHWRCGWPCRSRQPRSPDTDSAGSCYYPPQYSRCGSLCRATVQPAPPPYNEVTSKPDLYPMVIYLGADKGEGDLMVQYFKNYIVRPAGSLSATSTADSLSSSFLCNTANEANTIIPPPYSCAGSVEWASVPLAPAAQRQALLRSVSSVSCRMPSPQHLSPSMASSGAIGPNSASSPSAQISSENSQVFIDSQRSLKPTLAHSVSVPNNRLYQTDTTVRLYSDESNSNISIAEHHLGLILEGCSGNKISNRNQNNTKDHHKNYPESRSPRVQINQYYNESSNDSNDENIESNIYASYMNQEPNISAHKIRNDESNDPYQQGEFMQDASQAYNEGMQQNFNIQSKNRDYSFPDSSCGRNTSAFNLHSFEENNFCPFFSHSMAEGTNNENVSSDYSNFAKNLNNFGSKEEIHRMYSVGGSMTGSDISSLANLGTPDSPPRATSPTSELKELLDKIQKLPSDADRSQGRDDDQEVSNFANDVKEMKNFFCKSRKNSLYMPLNLAPKNVYPGKVSPSSNICFKRQFSRKSWLSRSAPTTPCGSGFVPNILTISQRSGPSGSGRSSRMSKAEDDGSPLLTEQDISGDEGEH